MFTRLYVDYTLIRSFSAIEGRGFRVDTTLEKQMVNQRV